MKRRTRRRVRAAAVAALGLAVAAGWALAPRALRHVAAFRVERVEVVGTRFLEPYAVVRAAGLAGDANLFDDPDAWRYGVLTLPLVETVEVSRTPPSTVRLTVREVEPVALVPAPHLRAVSRDGRLLELDPAGAVLDLPILAGATVRGGRLGEDGRAAVAAIAALIRQAPELAARVSEAEIRAGSLRLVFRDGSTEALLPAAPTPVQLRQLRLAHADLSARGELERVRRIDLRFRDQVVVSFHPISVS